ncbi:MULTISPECIES: DUF2933 domain-containing protein [unclassified Streptomyces]|uniref:DUF2933 domain-containing protein n=1 Tax=unclassified Streptomyces TaxID=2593676 RepID=UPI003D91EB7F
MCLNKKVLAGLGAVAAVLLLLRPAWVIAALPVLILAICPLSMIFMMRGMQGNAQSGQKGASCGTGAKNLASDSHTATEADLSKQITDLQAELRHLKAARAWQGTSTEQHSPAVDMSKRDEADTRP